jgi:DNA transformation protein and related proteins
MFAGFGPVAVRRMFGGAGIFAHGMMIGLLARGVVYLKADEITRGDFEREGLGRFRYATKDGERSLASYWRMPERLYDEPDKLARWASKALNCARRAAGRKSLGKAGRRGREARPRRSRAPSRRA